MGQGGDRHGTDRVEMRRQDGHQVLGSHRHLGQHVGEGKTVSALTVVVVVELMLRMRRKMIKTRKREERIHVRYNPNQLQLV